MGLLTVHYDKFTAVNAVSSSNHTYVQQFLNAFKVTPGKLPGSKVHLTTVEGATPVI